MVHTGGMSRGHPLRVLSFMVVRARVSIARSASDVAIFPKRIATTSVRTGLAMTVEPLKGGTRVLTSVI